MVAASLLGNFLSALKLADIQFRLNLLWKELGNFGSSESLILERRELSPKHLFEEHSSHEALID
jgi:hypothetical protein